MTNKRKKSSRNVYRRQTLKALTGGLLFGSAVTILPSKWTKPVVNAVILPSHAQATPAPCTPDSVTIAAPGATTLTFEVNTYDETVQATGTAPFRFSLLQSPASATISSSGQILWNPEDDYTFAVNPPPLTIPFEVEVTDANNCVASLAWTIEMIIVG